MKNKVINKISNIIKKETFLLIFLMVMLVILILYLLFPQLRCFLSDNNIDPNFIVVFLTSIALIVSALQRKYDRKYVYDSEKVVFTTGKVEVVIGKLFTIMNQSDIFLKTIENIKKAIDNKEYFKDSNDIKSRNFIDNNKEVLGAYITMYFGLYIGDDWNLMNEKLSKLLTNCINLLENYNENNELIISQNYRNKTLSNIESILIESKILNTEICQLTEKMKNILLNLAIEEHKKIEENYIK